MWVLGTGLLGRVYCKGKCLDVGGRWGVQATGKRLLLG